MGSQVITNPSGAHLTISDFRSNVDADGTDITNIYGKDVLEFEISIANAATVTKGDVLMLVAPTATAPIRVAAATTADSTLVVGIADETITNNTGATAIYKISVVIRGLTVVNFVTETFVAGEVVTTSTTAGKADSTTPAATDLVGSVIGIVLQADETPGADMTWVYVQKM